MGFVFVATRITAFRSSRPLVHKIKTLANLRVFIFRKASSVAHISMTACFAKLAACVFNICVEVLEASTFF